MKNFLITSLVVLTLIGAYFSYRYYYVETLNLSEIVGHTDNPLANLAINFMDFDTGLTRNDLIHLKSNKDYWIDRIKEVDAIQDQDRKMQAGTQLLSDMMEDPTLKKICSGIMNLGTNVTLGLIQTILYIL